MEPEPFNIRLPCARLTCLIGLLTANAACGETISISPTMSPGQAGADVAQTNSKQSMPTSWDIASREVGPCNANTVQYAIGQDPSPSLIEALKRQSGAGTVRVLREGEGATRDFNSGRLNIHLDAVGRIVSVRCG
jgi:hypothetical protein